MSLSFTEEINVFKLYRRNKCLLSFISMECITDGGVNAGAESQPPVFFTAVTIAFLCADGSVKAYFAARDTQNHRKKNSGLFLSSLECQ